MSATTPGYNVAVVNYLKSYNILKTQNLVMLSGSPSNSFGALFAVSPVQNQEMPLFRPFET